MRFNASVHLITFFCIVAWSITAYCWPRAESSGGVMARVRDSDEVNETLFKNRHHQQHQQYQRKISGSNADVRNLWLRSSVRVLETASRRKQLSSIQRDDDLQISDVLTISGLAVMNNELYVRRVFLTVIEVYDVATLNHRRNISIPDLQCVSDMTSCPQCDVVYITNYCDWKVYAIDERGLRTSWSLPEKPESLSINSELNVVATFRDSRNVRIFAPSGQLVRNITLQSDIIDPSHTIQLDDNRFAVLHGMWQSPYRLCIVDGHGTVIESYEHLQAPNRMLLFNGWLIVADKRNFRLLLFNATPLTYTRELISVRFLEYPLGMAITADGSRLFVSYWTDKLKTYNLVWV